MILKLTDIYYLNTARTRYYAQIRCSLPRRAQDQPFSEVCSTFQQDLLNGVRVLFSDKITLLNHTTMSGIYGAFYYQQTFLQCCQMKLS